MLADTGAAKLREVSTAVERSAYVACQGTNVGTFAAAHMDLQEHGLGIEREHVDEIDMHGLGFQLHGLALAFQLIGTVAVDLACAVRRWHLLYVADKLL